jgi:uncharacterized membrane protein YdjX (TVP38/TMEM64 family)
MSNASSRTTEPRPALTLRRLALLLAVGIALFVTVSSDGIHAFLLGQVTAVGEIVSTRPVWGAVVFVLLSAVSAMLAFFSTGVIVPVALVTWGQMGTLLLLWIGWILGGVCAYTLSRLLGRRVVTALTSGDALAYGDRVSAKAPFRLILLFQLGVPSEIPGYVLGLLRYPFLTYLTALGLAELPYAVATVYLGDSFLQRNALLLLGLGLGIVLLGLWAFRELQKQLTPATDSPDTGR